MYQGERKDERGLSTGCIGVREKTREVLAQVVSGSEDKNEGGPGAGYVRVRGETHRLYQVRGETEEVGDQYGHLNR